MVIQDKKKFLNFKNINTILIFLSVILGFFMGTLFPEFMISIRWIGEVFFNMLKMLVLPLIFSALVSAVTSMGSLKKLGSIGMYTFLYILTSVCTAVLIGLFLFNTFKPGVGIDPILILGKDSTLQQNAPMTFEIFITSLFPQNILEAAVKFEIMPVVLFGLAFAVACASCGESAKSVSVFFTGIRNVFIKMITWVILLSPLGIFSLLGTGVAQSVQEGHLMQDLKGLAMFVLVFGAGLCLQIGWQLLAVKFVARRALKQFTKNSSAALVTAFGTSSSLATLPLAMDAAEKEKVRDDVNRFVMPFTATINLGSTVMYEASAAIFFAQILGLDLSLSHQIIIFVTSIVAGMGAAGVPESGLITMVTVLRAVNIPVSSITLLLPLDRILDRFRTMVNTWGNICCASVVNELVHRREKQLLQNKSNISKTISDK
ncbi:dicarboxylate/amino acid:cation symporter [Fluviispira sanaruensis]|uniref:Sodium:dicarboxylate symporter n=1 Tax=Fluviispira sanaruensis TaxID=2493639 RepID=A0A4P2VK16_FLUSA|nr:dicarboxylate/amino acid:cation symporter [Fluviispira sanaruensis]BBH53556.1 sodium:dicarboxylate symporter [Fluviispira sanaruensis]